MDDSVHVMFEGGPMDGVACLREEVNWDMQGMTDGDYIESVNVGTGHQGGSRLYVWEPHGGLGAL